MCSAIRLLIIGCCAVLIPVKAFLKIQREVRSWSPRKKVGSGVIEETEVFSPSPTLYISSLYIYFNLADVIIPSLQLANLKLRLNTFPKSLTKCHRQDLKSNFYNSKSLLVKTTLDTSIKISKCFK